VSSSAQYDHNEHVLNTAQKSVSIMIMMIIITTTIDVVVVFADDDSYVKPQRRRHGCCWCHDQRKPGMCRQSSTYTPPQHHVSEDKSRKQTQGPSEYERSDECDAVVVIVVGIEMTIMFGCRGDKQS
jgi:hypothetical protein